jgi:hypothetical protein
MVTFSGGGGGAGAGGVAFALSGEADFAGSGDFAGSALPPADGAAGDAWADFSGEP